MRIELDSSDDAQQIFESINSTGEKLTAADLIRNYIMMKRNNDEQEKIYDKYWLRLERIFPESKKLAEFFRFYLASKTCILTTEKELYSAFKEYWKNNMGLQKYMEILEDLLNYAKHFERLYLTNNKDSLGEEIHDYRKIQSYMPAPFTMQILEYHRKNLITEKQTSSILKLINTYLVRRYINGQDTSAISRFFPGFLKNVETRVEEQNSYSKIVDICTYYLVNENKGKAAFMPDDNQLYTYLETANAYSLSNIRWVLDKIEMQGNPAPVLLDSLNIEHIMPQTQNEYWENETGLDEDEYIKVINRIGNLTLAASSDNSKMGNKDFAHKKKVLESTQHLKLNEKILKKQRWLVADIEERTKELTSRIIEIFPYVQTDYYIRGKDKSRHIWLSSKHVLAQGYLNENNSLTVFADSQIRFDNLPSSDSLKEMREDLIEEEVIIQKDGVFQFSQDYTFNSPSTATDFILGGSNNGWNYWKDAEDQTINESLRLS